MQIFSARSVNTFTRRDSRAHVEIPRNQLLSPDATFTHPAANREANYPMMKLPLSLLAVGCAAVLAGCNVASSVTLTQENLDKIQDGMSATQVKTILGAPTESKEEPIPVVGGTKTTYTYTNSEGANVVIVLKNDTVQSKEGHFPAKK
ncbi:SmpA / OmlA family protein [Terrimicrobium sacchariphilum]|jgi:hypothetical protein|uniref:SmpA / OmlA family protein n=1 Tax=Terrimicrobium sacchariphilum TaxID=690879 RepID=A0A146G3W0_TERSA|nr:outer membrane protein assembly factor BamE [Terrimicrobium sacchariphilum]GAT32153.1 SmpA / OmlA family protein [Terrimicrobium sacchariphilum]